MDSATENSTVSEAAPATLGHQLPPPHLTIVVPCHNEEKVLPETALRLKAMIGRLAQQLLIAEGSIFFIDDGSSDGTWILIEHLACENSNIHGLKLSRNFGQQSALLAGLLSAPGDILISIDADLQDDVEAMEEMVQAHAGGAEVIYGIRRNRQTDSFFKRSTAQGYYRLLQVMGVELIFNHADYRLLSRQVVEELRRCKETNLFLRGLIPQLGFRAALVYYDRQSRFAGESQYPLAKMVSLAVNGITSFTEIPLKFITFLGVLVSLFSFGLSIWALAIKLFTGDAIPGWASIVIPVYMLGGIQLICLGVIGQYLAKIYSEAKARPRFIVEKSL
ncbi:MAG: glycosyltransferase family 2 protein [Terracidiphilus sp.]|jgi:glycosyltransferase involved in cell wall biosynthesis